MLRQLVGQLRFDKSGSLACPQLGRRGLENPSPTSQAMLVLRDAADLTRDQFQEVLRVLFHGL
jgi:hypothetical protein